MGWSDFFSGLGGGRKINMCQHLPVASIANVLALTTPNPNQKTPTVSHVQIGTTFFFSVAVKNLLLKKKKKSPQGCLDKEYF